MPPPPHGRSGEVPGRPGTRVQENGAGPVPGGPGGRVAQGVQGLAQGDQGSGFAEAVAGAAVYGEGGAGAGACRRRSSSRAVDGRELGQRPALDDVEPAPVGDGECSAGAGQRLAVPVPYAMCLGEPEQALGLGAPVADVTGDGQGARMSPGGLLGAAHPQVGVGEGGQGDREQPVPPGVLGEPERALGVLQRLLVVAEVQFDPGGEVEGGGVGALRLGRFAGVAYAAFGYVGGGQCLRGLLNLPCSQ